MSDVFEFTDLISFERDLKRSLKVNPQRFKNFMTRMISILYTKTTQKTHFITGQLKSGWKINIPNKNRLQAWTAEIYNDVEYAAHVEWGHRIVKSGKTVGHVDGQYMLNLSMQELEPIFTRELDKLVEDSLKKLAKKGAVQ